MGISVIGGPSGGGSFGGKQLNLISAATTSVTFPANSYVDLFTINGSGILSELLVNVNTLSTNNTLGLSIFADGVEYPFFYALSNIAKSPVKSGNSEIISGSGSSIFETKLEIVFKTSLIIKFKNVSATSTTGNPVLRGGYYS